MEHFLPIARALAARYRGSEPFDDLMQVACVGLVKAVDRFDPNRGAPFSSYATPTILGQLKRYLRDHCWAVHVARGDQERALNVIRAQHQLSAETGRPPSVRELAEYLEESVEDVLDGQRAAEARRSSSLDAPYNDDSDEHEGTLRRHGWVSRTPVSGSSTRA